MRSPNPQTEIMSHNSCYLKGESRRNQAHEYRGRTELQLLSLGGKLEVNVQNRESSLRCEHRSYKTPDFWKIKRTRHARRNPLFTVPRTQLSVAALLILANVGGELWKSREWGWGSLW